MHCTTISISTFREFCFISALGVKNDVKKKNNVKQEWHLPVPMIKPLTKQFDGRLGTICFKLRHVDIINKDNLNNRKERSSETDCVGRCPLRKNNYRATSICCKFQNTAAFS